MARSYFTTALATISVMLMLPLATRLFAAPPKPIAVPDAEATTEKEMKLYAELIEHTDVKIEMLPIPGGKFVMGSPEGEKGRNKDEGPQHEVEVGPFWMAKCEIPWDVYEVWSADLDIVRRKLASEAETERDKASEIFQISQPTKPYTDMTFGMGKRGYPAICMTQHSCRTFCKWLSAKTGRYYRLPTEAEWEYACRAGTKTTYSFGDDAEKLGEYACRAGTKTAYSFGDDPEKLPEYAWFYDNSNEKYQKIGKKKPNPWGLHDMHGNVAEWVLDQHTTDFYGKDAGKLAKDPLAIPLKEYGRVVRGGSWDGDPALLRSAARGVSIEDWKQQDPQIPQSIWYLTDALNVGFRIVRPLKEPSEEEKVAKWDKSEPPQIDKDKNK